MARLSWSGNMEAQRQYQAASATLKPRSKAKKRKKKNQRRVNFVAKTGYQKYLQSDWWKERRLKALKHSGRRCERCQSARRLEVHHRNYHRLFGELDVDLEVLCRDCHADHHFPQGEAR